MVFINGYIIHRATNTVAYNGCNFGLQATGCGPTPSTLLWCGLAPPPPPLQWCWCAQVLVQPSLKHVHVQGHLHPVRQPVVLVHHPVREELSPNLQLSWWSCEQSLVDVAPSLT